MKKYLVRFTYPIWKAPLIRILNRAYQKRIINSKQWNELAAMFDRTQPKHYLMEKLAGDQTDYPPTRLQRMRHSVKMFFAKPEKKGN